MSWGARPGSTPQDLQESRPYPAPPPTSDFDFEYVVQTRESPWVRGRLPCQPEPEVMPYICLNHHQIQPVLRLGKLATVKFTYIHVYYDIVPNRTPKPLCTVTVVSAWTKKIKTQWLGARTWREPKCVLDPDEEESNSEELRLRGASTFRAYFQDSLSFWLIADPTWVWTQSDSWVFLIMLCVCKY